MHLGGPGVTLWSGSVGPCKKRVAAAADLMEALQILKRYGTAGMKMRRIQGENSPRATQGL